MSDTPSPHVHVLIADDEPGTRELVRAAVEHLGHRVTAAEDGAEAWSRYRDELPEVVIADWQMPGMDGTELSRAIRSHGASPYAYVLVLTGAADEEAARLTMEAGADDLLLKPLDPAQLERKLIAAERVTAMHRRLHEDARHDTLTGLGNRLRLAEDLEAVCGRVERYGHSFCVARFDVDAFKGYTDAADTPITGSALDRASAVALRHAGGGRVTGTEVRDEEGSYEIEVTRSDGSQVDVHLDRGFRVLNERADGEGADGAGED